MQKIREYFALPNVEDFYDHKKSIHIIIIALFVIAMFLMLTVPNYPERVIPMITPFIFMTLLFVYRKVLLNDIKLFGKYWVKYLAIVVQGFLLLFLFANVGGMITGLFDVDMAANQEAVNAAFREMPFVAGLYIALTGPIIEELAFRRAIQGAVKNRVLYYLLASIIFGVLHTVVDFSFPTSFAHLPSYALMGFGFAYIYRWSKNIWCPIIVHVIWNSLGVIMIAIS